MTLYTRSLSTTITFRQNLLACKEPAVDFDASDDYSIFDNQSEVMYTQEGTRTLGRDGKITPAQVKTVVICHAGVYKITFRDLLNNEGHLKVGDIRAELPTPELDGLAPGTGDKLITGGKTYRVFAVDYDGISQMYITWSRA